MDKNEIRAKASALLASGTSKSLVFKQLSGKGWRDNQLALFIASYPDRRLCNEQKKNINILIVVMYIHAVFRFFIGFGIGAKMGQNTQWAMAAVFAVIPLLFAWGFRRNFAGAYNAYMILAIIQLPKQLADLNVATFATIISLIVTVATLAYVWYIRNKLFPDFNFVAPKKVDGQYTFSN